MISQCTICCLQLARWLMSFILSVAHTDSSVVVTDDMRAVGAYEHAKVESAFL
jgi:hypothetical protein